MLKFVLKKVQNAVKHSEFAGFAKLHTHFTKKLFCYSYNHKKIAVYIATSLGGMWICKEFIEQVSN